MSKTQNLETEESEPRIIDFSKEIDLDRIRTPNRSEKLHPYEDEPTDPDDVDRENSWTEFKQSVGSQPNKPLEITPIDSYEGKFDRDEYEGDYQLIDGDRRYRALEENEADTVACFIVDVDGDIDRWVRMFEANNFRRDNSPKQEARWIAKLYQPSLLPEGERFQDEPYFENMDDVAEAMGVSDATVSNRLKAIEYEYPIRFTLTGNNYATNGRSLTKDRVKKIDRIIDCLKRGGDQENMVVTIGREQFVAEELANMEGVSLGEIETVAEKAVEGGWGAKRFLEYTEEHYAHDEVERMNDEVESGMMDGSDDPFEDNDFEDDSGVSVDDVDVGRDEDSSDEQEIELESPDYDVDWNDIVDDSGLENPISDYETQRMMSQTVEDEAAVAINIFADRFGLSKREVMKHIVEPAIVDEITARLEVEE